MDDYIALAIPTLQEQLNHVANDIMGGIHDVFPEDTVNENDPISHKKLNKLEGMWAIRKDVLRFTFHWVGKMLWLELPKWDAIVATLKSWLRSLKRANMGVPFKEFQSVISKI